MRFPSAKLFVAFLIGVTVTAMRGYSLAESSSRNEGEMLNLVILGVALLTCSVFWELIRHYQQLNDKYTHG